MPNTDSCLTGSAGARMLATLALALASLVASPRAHADAVTAGHVTAELVTESLTIRPGETFTAGISLRPEVDWHTYWKNPGDSGLATTVEWKLPPGITAGELEWPHPVRLGTSPYVTYGYEGDALLLSRISVPASMRDGSELELVAVTRWLACRADACIPGRAELSRRVRVSTAEPARNMKWAAAFDEARAKIPRPADGWTAAIADAGKNVRIEVTAPAPRPTTPEVFPTTPRVLDASGETTVTPTERGFVIEAAKDNPGVSVPAILSLVLVTGEGQSLVVEAKRADVPAPVASTEPAGAPPVERAAPAASAESRTTDAGRHCADGGPGDAAGGDVTFWAALGLAFLGGLVLNLMPCVFPVLSLKILGFVHVAHHDAAVIRRHGYAFAAGVVASFWVLAAALLALRAAGGALGWGFQLQEPLFVAAMAALLLAMSLNLLGVFELGTSLSSAAGRFDSHSGYRGSFLSGVLATVLATPCSAPFMGTAIGYALVQPAFDSLAVFTMLGAGMAAPYLVLACVPLLMRRLPRPGAWMETFRRLMAFPLLATVAWLVWVFGQQTGNDGVLGLLFALLLGSFAAWLYGHFVAGTGRTVARALALGSIAGAIYLTAGAATPEAMHGTPSAVAAVDEHGVQWHPWDPDAIARHRSEGRAVLVDFTADWCLSCKVNERVALTGEEFAATMRSSSAIAMKADWTRSDPRITRALSDFGRSGVPLYVVYPSDPAKEPIVLPQILTPALVRDALQKAVS